MLSQGESSERMGCKRQGAPPVNRFFFLFPFQEFFGFFIENWVPDYGMLNVNGMALVYLWHAVVLSPGVVVEVSTRTNFSTIVLEQRSVECRYCSQGPLQTRRCVRNTEPLDAAHILVPHFV